MTLADAATLSPGQTTALLALMLGAALAGAWASGHARLPQIVGFLLAGLALKWALVAAGAAGVAAAAVLAEGQTGALDFVKHLALTVVMFTIGMAFELHHLRRLGRSVWAIGGLQLLAVGGLVFAAGSVAALAAGVARPFLAATFMAILAVSVSPAATLLTIRQYQAKGPATEAILAVTGLSTIVAILLFDVVSTLGAGAGWLSIEGGGCEGWTALLRIVAATGGSMLIGVAGGVILAVLHGRVTIGQEVLAALGLLLGVMAMAGPLGLDYLLVCLMAGMAFINVAADPGRLEQRLAAVAGPLLALLFVMAGFSLHVEVFAEGAMLGLMIVYVLARSAGKIGGAWLAVRLAAGDLKGSIGLGLLCHAGVAIGLVGRLHPPGESAEWVHQLAAVVLGSVAVFELSGPLLLKRTIVSAGEVKAFRLFHLPGEPGGLERLREALASLLRRMGLLSMAPRRHRTIRARHVMHVNAKVLPASADLNDVLHFIERSHLDHFPVVDANRRFIGTISLADVRDMIYQPELRHLVAAQDLLEVDRVAAGPDETLEELFDKFHTHRARDLVIVDPQSRTVLGIVEQRDVLRAMHMQETGEKPESEH